MSKTLDVDNTWCNSFRQCPQKGYYRHELGKVRETVASPLNFGAAFHRGMANWLRNKPTGECISSALKGWQLTEPQGEGKVDWRSPTNLVSLLEAAMEQPKPAVLIAPNGEPVVEADGFYPLLTTPMNPLEESTLTLAQQAGFESIKYWFIIDGAVTLTQESIYVLDHKTTTTVTGERGEPCKIGPTFVQSFHPNAQMQGYCWGLSHYLKQPVNGVMINAIGVHSKRIISPNFTKADYFCFERPIINYTPAEIDEWRMGVVKLVHEYLQSLLFGQWRKQDNSCFSYFRACPYLQVCQTAPAARATMLDRDYVIDFWHPAEARKKEEATS